MFRFIESYLNIYTSDKENSGISSITTSFLAGQQSVLRVFWKGLYHYMSMCVRTGRQYAPKVILVGVYEKVVGNQAARSGRD